jgi:hypothetical protein
MEVIEMHIDKITLTKDGRLPPRLLHELHIKENEPLTVFHSKAAIFIIKQTADLTDFLSDLITSKHAKWNEMDYPQYLLKRIK